MPEDNEIAPFKNVLNEMYSRDISKKVHASYHLQATKGKFTGVVPPLGYQKDPEEKGHLLIDDETAPIVRKIFQWAVDGHGINFISRELERQQIPARHGGTGNGDSAPITQNGKRKTRKMGNMYGMNPI